MIGGQVYAAISGMTGDLAAHGIAKARHNEVDGYAFRGIDDVYNALSGLLTKHGLCVLPKVLERHACEQRSTAGEAVFCVTVRSSFELVSVADGSSHTVESYGEAIDASDKATAKAMSAAYKYAMLQAFCVPTNGSVDADVSSPKLRAVPSADAEPDQGWAQWRSDVEQLANACISDEALTRLQTTYRRELRALSLAQPTLYAELGRHIRARHGELALPSKEVA